MRGQRCCPCPAAGRRRRKTARMGCPGRRRKAVKDEVAGHWHSPGWCQLPCPRCHLRPDPLQVHPRAPAHARGREQQIPVWTRHVWPRPKPPACPGRRWEAVVPLSCQLGSGSLSCLGGWGCQALQPASLTALITRLRGGGQEGAGGDSCVPAQLLRALAESHIHPSGCH